VVVNKSINLIGAGSGERGVRLSLRTLPNRRKTP